jgi:phenylalanyl-tRNA synthetase beta chain
MKFTFSWLKEFVDFTGSAEELAKLLTMAGLEVESIAPLHEAGNGHDDQVFEVAVTPNRGDCLGIAGIAREVGALSGTDLHKLPTNAPKKGSSINERISLTIENAGLCARYSARIVDGVRIAPSPSWLSARLEACGIRAINNVVDVTNYVMLETGQPLHAFDLDRLPHKRIVVRKAKELAKFTTLDGVVRELAHEDLLICDDDRPVALAGLMGGMDSEVTDSTRSLLLESANFAPAWIRRTAKRLALHSEASHRFERGVDPEGTLAAANRAVYLLGEVAGGKPMAGSADSYPGKTKPPVIVLREERIEKLLGLKLDGKQAERLLRSIGMTTTRHKSNRSLRVIPPTSRSDISREADLIEELARLYSYDRIPTTLPLLRPSGGKNDSLLGWERKARALMTGEGLVEVINLPFTTEPLNRSFPGLWEGATAPVEVLNPLAKDHGQMRHSLLPGLIENLRLNLAHRVESFAAYHLGKAFQLSPRGEPMERQCLAGLLHGPRARRGLGQSGQAPRGFLDCKGLVEALLYLFHLKELSTWSATAIESMHPGQTATLYVRGQRAGVVGQLHPDACERLEVPPSSVFELDFEKLLEYAPRRITSHAVPRFPAVERDMAIVVDRDFASQQVIIWIKNLGEALIENVEVFDQYLGAPIPEGKKSLAYKVSYRAGDRTLTDQEVNSLHRTLVEGIGKTFGAEMRS